MSMKELIPIDHNFDIKLSKLNIKLDDVEKISKAWANGHFVFFNVQGDDIENVTISVFTRSCKYRVVKDATEITSSWRSIKKILKNNNLPDEWLDAAITKVCERMEERHETRSL